MHHIHVQKYEHLRRKIENQQKAYELERVRLLVWLFGCLVVWLVVCLVVWLFGWLFDLCVCLFVCLCVCLIYMYDCMFVLLCDWV